MCHRALLYFFALAAGAFFAAALAGAASFVDFTLAEAAVFSAFSAFGAAAFFSAAGFSAFAGAAVFVGVSAAGAVLAGASALVSAFFAAPLPPIETIFRIVCCWRWPALRR